MLFVMAKLQNCFLDHEGEKMNDKYVIRLWFEHGGECLWAVSEKARERFFTVVHLEDLPISEATRRLAEQMNREYITAFDWNDFSKGSVWSEEQKKDFVVRGENLRNALQKELGDEYVITYDPNSF